MMRLLNRAIRLSAAFILLPGLATLALAQGGKPAPAPAPAKKSAPAPAQPKAPPQKVPAPAPKAAAPVPVAKAPAPAAPKVQKAPAPKATKPAAPAAVEVADKSPGGRRDPFEALVRGGRKGEAVVAAPTIAGKGGLVIATMRLDGVVRAPSGMIAVVSNPQQRVYFLREGDRLFDGRVEKIVMDAMTLREMSKDAFGKPLERVVTKRLYPSAGEQR